MKRLLAYVKHGNWGEWVGWPVWLATCFLAALVISGIAVGVGEWIGYGTFINSTLGSMVISAFIYVVLIALLVSISRIHYDVTLLLKRSHSFMIAGGMVAVGAILFVMHNVSFLLFAVLAVLAGLLFVLAGIAKGRRLVTQKVLGIGRLLSWSDIGLGIAGYVIYFVVFIAITIVLTKLIPAYNSSQAQDLGFNALFGIDRTIGFIVLVIVAPIAEELAMRGFLFGKLRESKLPFWPAAIIVSVMFGLAHGQWNVGVDTFILSMAACYLREATGVIWPGVIIHMTKNAVAYVMLFVIALR